MQPHEEQKDRATIQGVETMSKTVLANVDGFTPVIDVLVDEIGLMSAVVFGRMWRYCQMEDGVCKAALEAIADGIGVDRATVMRHAKELVDAGYLKDLTPDLRNRPHVYVDTGKAGLAISISGVAESKSKNTTVAESNTSVAQSNVGVAESKLNKDFKKELKTNEMPLEWKLGHDEEITDDEVQEARIKDEAPKMFEKAFGFGKLPWYSNKDWTQFAKFVIDIYKRDKLAFGNYIVWRAGDGKYTGMSNKQIRMNPKVFMDTGWLDFESPVDATSKPAINEQAVESTLQAIEEKWTQKYVPPPPNSRPNIRKPEKESIR
jgi:hypothetical protein